MSEQQGDGDRAELLYTQRDGFTEYRAPEGLQWKAGEEWDGYRERLGFKQVWVQSGESLQILSPTTESCFTPGAAEAWHITKATGDVPRYYVEAHAAGDGDWEVIWVKNRGDLLALRIQLSQLLLAEQAAILLDLRTMAKRTFHKDHEHGAWEVCSVCDPDEHRLQEERKAKARQERQEREAKERVLFAFNRKEARVGIFHAHDSATLEKRMQELALQPHVVLALSEQGTFRDYKRLLKRFEGHLLPNKRTVFAASPEIMQYINAGRARAKADPLSLVEPEAAN